ncbi:MAG TPA: TetR/AcrR family transcriptional regulator [Burkholderiaceae bacterium]|jgi:AcrR family transcriptional regulator
MATRKISALRPRKTPRQARSEATVDAIFEATIQVLLVEGASGLTTTRVAERAGVSVGTMYQYFPHKQALLYAVLSRHMDQVLFILEGACRAGTGLPAVRMVEGLVAAYIEAKTSNTEISIALYRVTTELDVPELLGKVGTRLTKAINVMLGSASDLMFDDVALVTNMLRAAMTGVTRTVFEQNAGPALIRKLHAELLTMCQAYVQAVGVMRKAGVVASRAA